MSAMEQKPTVLWVHGAWHGPECFAEASKYLASAGYGIKTVQLPTSTHNGPYPQNIDDDVEVIQNALNDIVLTDSDIVVVMHSYGGVPGSSAAKGFSKTERHAKGKDGGIIQMVYMCAFAMEENEALTTNSGGKVAPWVTKHEDGYFTSHEQARDIFYNDLPDDEAQKWVSMLRRHAVKAFDSPATYAAWKHIPSTYIFCGQDRAIPPEVQEYFISREGANYNVIRFEDSSHSPFLSRPKEVAEAIRRSAGEKF